MLCIWINWIQHTATASVICNSQSCTPHSLQLDKQETKKSLKFSEFVSGLFISDCKFSRKQETHSIKTTGRQFIVASDDGRRRRRCFCRDIRIIWINTNCSVAALLPQTHVWLNVKHVRSLSFRKYEEIRWDDTRSVIFPSWGKLFLVSSSLH